jgi:hypothetical protein
MCVWRGEYKGKYYAFTTDKTTTDLFLMAATRMSRSLNEPFDNVLSALQQEWQL